MRGDIHRLPAPKTARGHEQSGTRYAVIVQSDALPLSTVLVAPTTTGSFPASFHPEVDMNGTTARVLVEQTRVIDAQALGDFAGRLGANERAEVDRALRLVMGLF